MSPAERSDLIAFLGKLSPEYLQLILNAQEHAGRYIVHHPSVPSSFTVHGEGAYFATRFLNERGMMARDLIIHAREEIEEAGRDPIFETLTNMARYVDDSFVGEGWSPSELMAIRYSLHRTSLNPDRIERGGAKAEGWIKESRRRYKRGFHANPLTAEPIPRRDAA